jgi:hypothetical protein
MQPQVYCISPCGDDFCKGDKPMKQFIMTAMVAGLLAIMALTGLAQNQAPSQSAVDQAALFKQVSAELKQLRLEMLEQAIEFQNWKIQRLEAELQPIQIERQRLGEEEQFISQHLAELEKLAGNASEEVEAVKAVYTEKRSKEVLSKRQLVMQREAELTEQLAKEQQRLQELTGKAKKLQAEG